MKAICIEKPGEIHVAEIALPQRKEGEALIEVKSMGVCGSDVAAYRFNHPNCHYPLIIGHEIAGIVREIGPNATGIAAGDRVVLDPYLYCGHCYPCSQGHTNCCESLHVLGVQVDGAMCEYVAHPADMLIKIPDSMTWKEAALAEPLTIGIHGIHTMGVQAGEHVTIIGAGTIGLMAALTAKAYGAVPILVDVVDGRLQKAREMGLEYTVNSLTEDAEAYIRDLTHGRMSETVMEASGAEAGIANALRYASYLGRIALTGWPKGDVMLPTALITRKELQVRGSRTSVNEFAEAIDLISQGKVDVNPFITVAVPFEELPEHIIGQAQHPDTYLKIVGLL